MSGSKRRPALVLADLPGDDILLCQITSQNQRGPFAIPLNADDFMTVSLPQSSFIRPSRIFTADKNIVIRKTGTVITSISKPVVESVIALIQ